MYMSLTTAEREYSAERPVGTRVPFGRRTLDLLCPKVAAPWRSGAQAASAPPPERPRPACRRAAGRGTVRARRRRGAGVGRGGSRRSYGPRRPARPRTGSGTGSRRLRWWRRRGPPTAAPPPARRPQRPPDTARGEGGFPGGDGPTGAALRVADPYGAPRVVRREAARHRPALPGRGRTRWPRSPERPGGSRLRSRGPAPPGRPRGPAPPVAPAEPDAPGGLRATTGDQPDLPVEGPAVHPRPVGPGGRRHNTLTVRHPVPRNVRKSPLRMVFRPRMAVRASGPQGAVTDSSRFRRRRFPSSAAPVVTPSPPSARRFGGWRSPPGPGPGARAGWRRDRRCGTGRGAGAAPPCR
ncbi:hypothetical protein STEPF1_04826 [Streptomyces sp. F-1]|nr:hypothetical protein STEPF1_04826 [Streptomyces sp. F-1]